MKERYSERPPHPSGEGPRTGAAAKPSQHQAPPSTSRASGVEVRRPTAGALRLHLASFVQRVSHDPGPRPDGSPLRGEGVLGGVPDPPQAEVIALNDEPLRHGASKVVDERCPSSTRSVVGVKPGGGWVAPAGGWAASSGIHHPPLNRYNR